jgi:hydrogenase maturation protease
VSLDGGLERPAPEAIGIAGVEVRRGSRVRLRPRAGADAFDMALAGREAIVAGIEQDYEERVHVSVTLDDDPGRSLGSAAQLGHRFFFSPEEIEPLGPPPAARRRVLVAGIGNVFLADDGFGVEVVRRLLTRPSRPGVAIADFGIRGMDLAYALQEGWDAAVLVDAAPRGERPGTLSVIEPLLDGAEGRNPDGHGMDPVQVLRLARTVGSVPPCIRLVVCEPATVTPADSEDIVMELSEPVRAALDAAVQLVERVVDDLQDNKETTT